VNFCVWVSVCVCVCVFLCAYISTCVYVCVCLCVCVCVYLCVVLVCDSVCAPVCECCSRTRSSSVRTRALPVETSCRACYTAWRAQQQCLCSITRRAASSCWRASGGSAVVTPAINRPPPQGRRTLVSTWARWTHFARKTVEQPSASTPTRRLGSTCPARAKRATDGALMAS